QKISNLSLKIGVATQTFRKSGKHLLAISNGYSAVTHGLLGSCTKLLVHGIGIVFNVAQYVGNAVTVQLMHIIDAAIGIDAHTGNVGVTEKIMQITQCFLISPHQKNTEIIFFASIYGVQRYRIGFAFRAGKFLQLAITVAGQISNNCLALWLLI